MLSVDHRITPLVGLFLRTPCSVNFLVMKVHACSSIFTLVKDSKGDMYEEVTFILSSLSQKYLAEK